METGKDEIARAKNVLGLTDDQFRELPNGESQTILDEVLNRFVGGSVVRWWWEHFTAAHTAVHLKDGGGFRVLPDMVPDPTMSIWFIAEENQLPFYPVYETSTEVAQKILEQCYSFEYYLVDPEYSWILCENHHGYLIGVGEEVISRLDKIST